MALVWCTIEYGDQVCCHGLGAKAAEVTEHSNAAGVRRPQAAADKSIPGTQTAAFSPRYMRASASGL
jgi:hypothetical protein